MVVLEEEMADSGATEGEMERANSGGGKKEARNVIFTDPKALDCDICCEPLDVPVYQCKKGHISCSDCCTKLLNKCPNCVSENCFIRSRGIEKVLESIQIHCQNSIYGCNILRDALGTIEVHEPLCTFEPCLCPLPDCLYVGSAEQLSSHFRKKHKGLAKRFSYSSLITICLNSDDRYCIFQADDDGVLFVLFYSFETFGNVVTMSRIGAVCSEITFCYEIKAKTQGSILSLKSVVKVIQGWTEVLPASKRSLLIPNEYFGSSAQSLFEFRIWPVL